MYLPFHFVGKSNRRNRNQPPAFNDGTETPTFGPTLLLWYLIFGAVHELSHLLAAASLGLTSSFLSRRSDESILVGILRAILGRAVNIPGLSIATPFELFIVRHSGWVASIVAAWSLHLMHTKTTRWRSAQLASWITVAEAITTDLLGFGICGIGPAILLCGNFGVILINPLWTADSESSKLALDLLAKMINVTMMRGAQSGGVITWAKNNKNEYHGIRSRVVNGKRTDLSKRVREKVESDTFAHGKIKTGIQGFYGHSRFATSSKATFDGTHPLQWTPPTARQVYLAAAMISSSPKSSSMKVENYICHNGDFDFFRVNGHYYDLRSIQNWLVHATSTPMPTIVDSCAIAGMIDIIRTAGCFALSARFALLLGMQQSKIDESSVIPSCADFEVVGNMFEYALEAFCAKKQMSPAMVGDDRDLREFLAVDTVPSIKQVVNSQKSFATLFSNDIECGTSGVIGEFVRATFNAFFDNDLLQTTKYFLENAKGSFGLFVSCSLDAHRSICIAARGQTMSIAFYPKKGIICYGSGKSNI
jgi:hypothetical protein